MKFLLTSSGISNASLEKALLELAGKPASEIAVAFVPTAASMITGDKGWLIENLSDFKGRGFKSIDIVDISAVPKENWLKRFETADVLCFGGGDEQYLVKMMRESGVAEVLPELLKTRIYMGISAGSMVVGKLFSQELMRTLLPEEAFEGNDEGLGVLDLSILPHLNSDYFAHLRSELIRSLAPQFPCDVYALDDTSALKIIDDQIEVITEGEFLKLEK